MKKVIIAGGRDFNDKEQMRIGVGKVLLGKENPNNLFNTKPFYKVTLITGKAEGADALGEDLAKTEWHIPIEEYPAQWDDIEGKPKREIGKTKYGKKYWKGAGHARNRQMAEVADILIAFWDGRSRGTHNMIKEALDYGLEVHVFRY